MINSRLCECELLKHWPAESDWTEQLEDFFLSEGCKSLSDFVSRQRTDKLIFPEEAKVFRAFESCSFRDTKVVVLGQDPYHGKGQADGLCFSVPTGVRIPPSLKNILKELNADLGIDCQGKSELVSWAVQGVLLLNTVLTVESGKANSHRKQGWEQFTDLVIKQLSNKSNPIIFVLWGKPAATKTKLISAHHKIIKSTHPSPLSAYRGFIGSNPFSTINELLLKFDNKPIDWRLRDSLPSNGNLN